MNTDLKTDKKAKKSQTDKTITERQKIEIQRLNDKITQLNIFLRNQEALIQMLYASESWKIGHKIIKALKSTKVGYFIVRYLHKKQKVESSPWFKSPFEAWQIKHKLTEKDIEKARQTIKNFKYLPKISIIITIDDTQIELLKKCIESVFLQIYDDWELLLAYDNSVKSEIKNMITEHANKDKKLKIVLSKNKPANYELFNAALQQTSGEFIGLLRPDDELSIDALYENAKLLNAHPEADMIYSDEDKKNEEGQRHDPDFKPDWSPDLFLSIMYTGNLGIYRKKLLVDMSGLRNEFEGNEVYDMVLRFTEKTDKIFHVPKILYHKKGQTSYLDMQKTKAAGAKKALEEALKRRKIEGVVVDGIFPASFRVKRKILDNPLVSIIIPIKDHIDILKKCLNSIWTKTNYKNYEIIIVDNKSEEWETLNYLEKINGTKNVKILKYEKPFNFSAINNFAVQNTNNEHLLLLNNDIEVISADWLSAMLEHAQRQEVGAVGCKLIYPNNTIQHAGMIIGLGGGADHSHKHFPKDNPGDNGRLQLIQNLSGVTAACMLIKKSVFEEVGRFDEKNLGIAFNDLDLCLKIRQRGYLIVYTPYAELYHHESLTRGYEDTTEKYERFLKEIDFIRKKWGKIIDRGDPYYNPNLTLDRKDFSVKL